MGKLVNKAELEQIVGVSHQTLTVWQERRACRSVSITTKAKQTAKELCLRAEKVVYEIAPPLMALRDLGKHLKDCQFTGWTMQECIVSLVARIRIHAALMPTPIDPKTATTVRGLLREGQAALDDLDECAELLACDCGMKYGVGAAILGAGIENLAIKAATAFESAAASMEVRATAFACYEPPQEERAAA